MTESPVVTLGSLGAVKGVTIGDNGGIERFTGIPYAAPPLAELRFRRPQAYVGRYADSDGNPMDCSAFGPVCPQPPYYVGSVRTCAPPENQTISEDCLKLNIWRPAHVGPDEKLPVYIYIHGGWLQVGNPLQGDDDDPRGLLEPKGAGMRAVVVAIGYRLNVFGFLAGPGCSGNFGLWDQWAGIEWVHQHIHHFGGDPSHVTVGGLSAGSFSTNAQLQYALLGGKGAAYFQHVFMQSNAIPSQPKQISEVAEQFGQLCRACNIFDGSDADKLAALRQVPSAKLVDAIAGMDRHTFRAVTDGEFFRSDYFDTMADGRFAKAFRDADMRVMIGEVENEETTYRDTLPPTSREKLPVALENYYPKKDVLNMLKLPVKYALDDAEQLKDYFGELVARGQVRGSLRLFCKALVDGGVPLSRIYRYRISMRLSMFDAIKTPLAGVPHGFDRAIWAFSDEAFQFSESEFHAIKAWIKSFSAFICDRNDLDDWGTHSIAEYRHLHQNGSITIDKDSYWETMLDFAHTVLA